jgi:FkbM family methyltransferase
LGLLKRENNRKKIQGGSNLCWKRACVSKISNLVAVVLAKFGLAVIRTKSLEEVNKGMAFERHRRIFSEYPYDLQSFSKLSEKSKSQLGQDLLAVACSEAKRGGFFVEFGATNGLELSNTYLLEKELGWSGILAEPAKVWHRDLEENRNVEISKVAVWSLSGETMKFLETSEPELSTLTRFSASDQHARKGTTYEVETLSLMDLLLSRNAPPYIDFISIDTEGSEFEILENFDFSKFSFGLLCIEHNYTSSRESVSLLLQSNGYECILEDVSRWDAWFVPVAVS